MAVADVLNNITGEWIHVSEIGGPQHFNDMALAEAMAENGDFGECRISEYPNAAKLGRKQYWYSTEKVSDITGTRQNNGVVSKVTLAADEAREVREELTRAAAARASWHAANTGYNTHK